METIMFNALLGIYAFIVLFVIIGCMISYFDSPTTFKIFDNTFFIVWVFILFFLLFIAAIAYCVIMALMLIFGNF